MTQDKISISQMQYRSLLHLRNTRPSNNESDILARLGRIISPLWEKTRSTGAELAGTQKILEKSMLKSV